MKPESLQAVEFLKAFHPEGPWVLTCIDQDKKAILTQTFGPSSEQAAAEWIDRYNGHRNCYFSVNPTTRPLTKKAEREDILRVDYLHVDLDPRAGEDIQFERERILKLLRDPRGLPPPTWIVFSGGGYQGFWKLEEPIEIGGDLAKAEDAKRHNINIELTLGGDNTHNIDRIMRIPGTMNIPDARKRKKGRVPVMSSVVEHFPDRIYPTKLFPKSAPVQGDDGFSSNKYQVSGNIARLSDLDELGEAVPQRIKMLILNGHDPDEPNKYGSSRSEWLFSVCVGLVRAGVDDDTIYAVITDPNWKISESVIDKKDPEKYAIRQIERAHEEAIHPKLRELNEKHAVIGDIGGKCRVISEVYEPVMKRSKISRQSFDDFRNRYGHLQIELGMMGAGGKPMTKKLGHWWLEHPMHRHYETITFAPGGDVQGAYNLWRGFGCQAIPGDCSRLLTHIKENICSGNEEYYTYLIGWLARTVQHPDSPGEVAVVLRGRMGTGKSLFVRAFGSLFGRHFLQVSDSKHLVGSFNSHLRDCVVLFGDEAFFAGDKRHEGVLKTLITEPYITFEAKGVDAETGPNFTHILLASNSSWVVPAGSEERRYFVLDVGDGQMQNSGYFQKIVHELEHGGREAFLSYLMSYELGDFNVRTVPKTEALQEQKMLSMSPEEEWWYNKMWDGLLLPDDGTWTASVEKEVLFKDFYDYQQKLSNGRRATRTALHNFLSKVCPPSWPHTRQKKVQDPKIDDFGVTRYETRRPYFYEFPDLKTLRDRWTKQFNGNGRWPTVEQIEMDVDAPDQPPF
jgi:hypothetical protein